MQYVRFSLTLAKLKVALFFPATNSAIFYDVRLDDDNYDRPRAVRAAQHVSGRRELTIWDSRQ